MIKFTDTKTPRPKQIAKYFIDNKITIRETAEHFGVSKSLVNNDLRKLKNIDFELFIKVRTLLDYNKSQRAFRGGQSTQRKWKGVN